MAEKSSQNSFWLMTDDDASKLHGRRRQFEIQFKNKCQASKAGQTAANDGGDLGRRYRSTHQSPGY